MIEVLTVFAGVVLAQISPGPNLMAVASASLGSSRASGMATASGIATGVFIWAILFAFGIGALLETFPQTLVAMRLIGGGYLLFLGFRALKAAFVQSRSTAAAERSVIAPGAAYRRGLLVVMTNPKAALMWVAISMFLASSGLSSGQFLAIGIAASASAMAVYGVYAIVFSTGAVIRAYDRFFRAIEGAFGAVFGAIGGRLFVDGLWELRA